MAEQKPVAWAVSRDGKTPAEGFRIADADSEQLVRTFSKNLGGSTCALPLYAHPSEELAAARAEAEQFRALAKENSLELVAAIRERGELMATIEAAYAMAVDHDDRMPFDWAVYCAMLLGGIESVKGGA